MDDNQKASCPSFYAVFVMVACIAGAYASLLAACLTCFWTMRFVGLFCGAAIVYCCAALVAAIVGLGLIVFVDDEPDQEDQI